MGMIQEFKEFALKGNMVDMAVGIVMGAAVGKLVGSLVENMINPVVGVFLGGTDLGQFGYVLKPAEGDAAALVLRWGDFINAFIQFLILAFVVFMIIKAVNAAKRQLNLVKEAAPAGPSEVDLLTEIRDALQKS